MARTVSSRQRPDLLSPCRGHLRPARVASCSTRTKALPDCRHCRPSSHGATAAPSPPADLKQQCARDLNQLATWPVVRENGAALGRPSGPSLPYPKRKRVRSCPIEPARTAPRGGYLLALEGRAPLAIGR
jgi:hypothetical protein